MIPKRKGMFCKKYTAIKMNFKDLNLNEMSNVNQIKHFCGFYRRAGMPYKFENTVGIHSSREYRVKTPANIFIIYSRNHFLII